VTIDFRRACDLSYRAGQRLHPLPAQGMRRTRRAVEENHWWHLALAVLRLSAQRWLSVLDFSD
jgi:hypothetical protein